MISISDAACGVAQRVIATLVAPYLVATELRRRLDQHELVGPFYAVADNLAPHIRPGAEIYVDPTRSPLDGDLLLVEVHGGTRAELERADDGRVAAECGGKYPAFVVRMISGVRLYDRAGWLELADVRRVIGVAAHIEPPSARNRRYVA